MGVAPRHAWAVDAHIVGQLAHPALTFLLVVIVMYRIVASCAFEHGKVVSGGAVRRGRRSSADFVVVVLWKLLLFTAGCYVVAPNSGCSRASGFP